MMNFAKWPMALIAGLLGVCQAFATPPAPPALPSLAPPHPLPTIGNGAWVSQDEWRGLLHIHQPPPAPTVSLRLPGWLAVDLNTTAQVLCGWGASRLMRVSLPDQRLVQAGFSVAPVAPAPQVVASRTGTCASPGGDTRLLWLEPDGTPRTISLRLPRGMARFDWQALAYDDEQDVFIATGRQGFALIPAGRFASQAPVIAFHGALSDGELGEVRASQLRRCGAFLRKEQRLVCRAQLGDASLSAVSALVLIDADRGRLRKVLPPTVQNEAWAADLRDDPALHHHTERTVAMAHGQPPATPPTAQPGGWPQSPLPIRIDLPAAAGWLPRMLPTLTQAVARSNTLDDLRERVQAIGFSVEQPGGHPAITITLQDAASHTLRLSGPGAPDTRPAWQGQDHDGADWRRFKEACQHQASATSHAELAHLQCVLAAL